MTFYHKSYQKSHHFKERYQKYNQRVSHFTIDGFVYVNKLADELKKLPIEVRLKIEALHNHKNRKRIQLKRLGGHTSSNGKGFVIDRNVIVDGTTRRIENWIKKEKEMPDYIHDFFNVFFEHEKYKNIVKEIENIDKSKKNKCPNIIKMKPMEHGSLVHKEMQNIVKYALIKSNICKKKLKIPKFFHIDICTKMCIHSLLNKNLLPFISELPMFTSDGCGMATAIDLICVNLNQNYMFKMIEMKTGNCAKAIKKTNLTYHGIVYSQASAASLQLIMTFFLGFQTYGDHFFPLETYKDDFGMLMNVIYIRSWGSVLLEIPFQLCNMDAVNDISKRILFRKEGSLRLTLNENCNIESSKTVKGKIKKRPIKKFKIGFDS